MLRLLRALGELLEGEPEEPEGVVANGEGEGLDVGGDAETDYIGVERHILGPPAGAGGVGWSQRVTDGFDGNTQIQVEEKEIYRCESCGNFLGFGVNVRGVCSVCGRTVCEGPEGSGCATRCEECGDTICPKCAVRWGEHTYCRRCRFILYFRAFFGLLDS